MVEGAVSVSYMFAANCFTSDLRRADEQLEVSDIDIFAAFSKDQAFWRILFFDRKPGSDSRDKHSWICLSLESSIAVIIDILCSKSQGVKLACWSIGIKLQCIFLSAGCDYASFAQVT